MKQLIFDKHDRDAADAMAHADLKYMADEISKEGFQTCMEACANGWLMTPNQDVWTAVDRLIAAKEKGST